eukprot:scaffold11814_cov52-Phaeocystis_antarctica.AAC.6
MPSGCTASMQRSSRDEACSSALEIDAACSPTSASSRGDLHVMCGSACGTMWYDAVRCGVPQMDAQPRSTAGLRRHRERARSAAASFGRVVGCLRWELRRPSAVDGGAGASRVHRRTSPPCLTDGLEAELVRCEVGGSLALNKP